MNRQKVVIFGAGTTGRSFLGRIFGRHGWDIVFVEIDPELVRLLNEQGGYRVIIRANGRLDEPLVIRNVRAVRADHTQDVVREIADAEYIVAAVSRNNLTDILPLVAHGISRKFGPDTPGHDQSLDFILAEHTRSKFVRRALAELLPHNFPLDSRIGIVETCIDSVFPVMTDEELAKDPLCIYAEQNDTLIVDGKGFLNGIPHFEEIKAVHSIEAYNDRKLYVHNLGYSAAAYLGYQKYPDIHYVYEALVDPEIRDAVRSAMREASAAVMAEHPTDFTIRELDLYVTDLLERLENRGLGETVHHAGHDVARKIDRNNRIVGAMILAEKNGLPYGSIVRVFKAALTFQAFGSDRKLQPGDRRFIEKDIPKGLLHILTSVCGLNEDDPVEGRIISRIVG